MDVSAAARQLGISPTAVRKRLERGQLAGSKVAGKWDVSIEGLTEFPQADATADATRDTTRRDTTRQRDSDATAQVAVLQREVELLTRENERLSTALERSQQGESELRRMLNLEQQTVAALRALPAAPVEIPLERTEMAHSAPAGLEPPDTPPTDLAQALKEAGVTKKQRRKLLGRLAGVWRR